MTCGGCIRGGNRLVWAPGQGFCLASCTPVDPDPPESFRVDVVFDPSDPTGMTVIATVVATPDGSPVDIDWMDGSRSAPVAVGESVTHQYANPGTYQVTSFLLDFSDWVVTSITVPDERPTPPPFVVIHMDQSDPTGMTLDVMLMDNEGGGPITVDWGDGSPVVELEVGQNIAHTFPEPGTYQVVMTSVANPASTVTAEITVPSPPPGSRTWADVMSTWPTWGDIDAPTWNDLKNGT